MQELDLVRPVLLNGTDDTPALPTTRGAYVRMAASAFPSVLTRRAAMEVWVNAAQTRPPRRSRPYTSKAFASSAWCSAGTERRIEFISFSTELS